MNGREIQFVVTHITPEEVQPMVDQLRILGEARKTSEPNFQGVKSERGMTTFFMQTKLQTDEIWSRIQGGIPGFSVKPQSKQIGRIELDLR